MKRNSRQCCGFTLVEIMFAGGLSMLLILGIAATFIMHARSYRNQKLVRELQQNVRFALDSVVRDVRMAGYGLPVFDSALDTWIPWVTNLTNNPVIVPAASTNERDTVTLAAALQAPVASLALPAAPGATTLTVSSGEGDRFEASHHRVLFLDRTEVARVVSRAGDVLTISTDPALAGHGLEFAYTNGAPIERIDAVTYQWSDLPTNAPARPYLWREDYSGAVTQQWHKMVAGHIEDFQVATDNRSVTVTLTGRTAEPLYGHVDEAHGDSFYRMTVTTTILPRNAYFLRMPR